MTEPRLGATKLTVSLGISLQERLSPYGLYTKEIPPQVVNRLLPFRKSQESLEIAKNYEWILLSPKVSPWHLFSFYLFLFL